MPGSRLIMGVRLESECVRRGLRFGESCVDRPWRFAFESAFPICLHASGLSLRVSHNITMSATVTHIMSPSCLPSHKPHHMLLMVRHADMRDSNVGNGFGMGYSD